MTDHTGEYTGEFLFEGLAVTRALGTSYDDLSSPGGQGSSSVRRAPPRRGDPWLLEGDLDDPTPSEYAGLSEGELLRALRATRAHIVHRGLGPFATETIAEHSGLSPEARERLGRHFAQGSELAIVLIQRVHRPLFDDLSAAAVTHAPVLPTLKQSIARLLLRLRRDLPFTERIGNALTSLTETQETDPAVRAVLENIHRQAVQIVAAILAEGQMRSEVRPGDPEVLARCIVGMVHGLTRSINNSSRLVSAGIYAEDMVTGALDIMIDGLTLHP